MRLAKVSRVMFRRRMASRRKACCGTLMQVTSRSG
jgi:hypothetical protein